LSAVSDDEIHQPVAGKKRDKGEEGGVLIGGLGRAVAGSGRAGGGGRGRGVLDRRLGTNLMSGTRLLVKDRERGGVVRLVQGCWLVLSWVGPVAALFSFFLIFFSVFCFVLFENAKLV
jgi:hypothetical protein